MGYFIYNNIDSRQYGILQKVPYRTRSEQSSSIISIPGKTEPIFKTAEQYKETTLQMVLSVTNREKISEIYKWLSGTGILILSDDLTKYYSVKVCSEIVPEYISVRTCQIPISFTCKPFLYAVNDTFAEYGTMADIENNGTHYSEPIIKIYGTGDLTLTLNGEVWNLTDVDGYITIDTQRKVVYKDNTLQLNKISRADGRIVFPCLNVGVNRISTTGTKLEVKKNVRWL